MQNTNSISQKKYFTFSNLLFFLTVMVCIGTIFALFSSLSQSSLGCFFNSDTLYLASLYKDIFVDHNSLNGWHLNPAPNFFPDMIVYFLLMTITSNFIVTSFVYAIIQYIFFIYLIFRLFKILNLPSAKLIASLSNLLLLLFFFVSFFSNDFGFTFYLVSSAYHTGAFLMSLFCTILTFEYLKEKKINTLIYLCLISLLCIFSDRLFIVLYSIPWFLLIFFYLKIENRKNLIWINLINVLTVIIGLIAFGYLNKSNYVYVDAPHRMLDYAFFYDCLKLLFNQIYDYLIAWNFISLIIIISLITFIFNLVLSIKKLLIPKKLDFKDSYCILSTIFTVVVFFAPVINGSYTGYDTLRYNIYIFYMLVINFGIIVYFLIQRINFQQTKILNAIISILIIGATVNIAYQFNLKGFQAYFAYYPKDVECIDYIASKHKLYNGLGDYWSAKKVTMFSKKGIRVYSTLNTIRPYFHVMNRNWYKNDKFNFIISNDIENENDLLSKLFSNTKIIDQGEIKLILTPEFVYDTVSWEVKILNH